MWMTLKLCIGLVLLATVIDGDIKLKLGALKIGLTILSVSNNPDENIINGLFKLAKRGCIDLGGMSVLFKGERISDNLTVAMKFVLDDYRSESEREYHIFNYLNAINRPEIEQYGLPCLFYYGEWKKYTLMVTSYFDGGDLVRRTNNGFLHNPSSERQSIDSLILFRNFVLQSKYMHSRGVRHDDIKPENILTSGFRSFLIDFNLSSKMKELGRGGSIAYTARRAHLQQIRTATDDWESFLYTMCATNGIKLPWFDDKKFDKIPMEGILIACWKMKNNTKDTIEAIKNIKSVPLRKVFLEFAAEVFLDNPYPDYNRLYDFINTEIGNVIKPPEQPLFTWLNSHEKNEALRVLNENPLPDIRKEIIEPSEISEFVYVNPDYTFFQGHSGEASTSTHAITLPAQKKSRQN